jgi:hypothetical protein
MFRPNNQIARYLNADEYQRIPTTAERIRWYAPVRASFAALFGG